MPYGFGARFAPLLAGRAAGVSQPAQPNLPCALPPITPESPAVARERRFTAGVRLQHIRQTGRSLSGVTRPNRVRLRCGSQVRSTELRRRDCSRASSASLHAGRSVGMMNTFQFIGLVGGAGAPHARTDPRTDPYSSRAIPPAECIRGQSLRSTLFFDAGLPGGKTTAGRPERRLSA